ncbi:glycosyltransferase family 2 protein [Lapillicoccus sp.]|uniref:glycosyltransferase family 2 protein n=1 Tax=Lapillicoccus sp. TaxID=1909287 RepID=UPI0025CFEBB7|nr:glycosyltransferase family 2 protein [Lapillicoccus sp.]
MSGVQGSGDPVSGDPVSDGVRPVLRVVVVTWFAGDFLPHFVESLGPASTAAVAVTVVDNGSTDGTVEWARAQPDLTLVETGRNLGYGGGANVGVRASDEPWVLIANSDLTIDPGALDELFRVAGRWPRAGVLGPRILTPDGRLYPSARELPSLGRGIGHALFGWLWPTNPWTASYRRERGDPREETTGWLSGACLLVRREAFEAVGGFDESYFMYFEDTDLCERIGRAGWDNVYAPSAVVRHHGGASTSLDLVGSSKAHHDSAYRYLSRRYAGPRWAPVRLALRVGLWARFQLSRRVTRVVHGAEPTRDGRSPTP